MARFGVYYHGAGDGCDYTIACNQQFSLLPPRIQTMDAAIAWLTQPDNGNGYYEPYSEAGYEDTLPIGAFEEEQLERVTVFEIAEQQTVNLAAFWAAAQQQQDAEDAAEAETERRQLYEKLKAEFEAQ